MQNTSPMHTGYINGLDNGRERSRSSGSSAEILDYTEAYNGRPEAGYHHTHSKRQSWVEQTTEDLVTADDIEQFLRIRRLLNPQELAGAGNSRLPPEGGRRRKTAPRSVKARLRRWGRAYSSPLLLFAILAMIVVTILRNV